MSLISPLENIGPRAWGKIEFASGLRAEIKEPGQGYGPCQRDLAGLASAVLKPSVTIRICWVSD